MEGETLCFTVHVEENSNPENLHWDVKKPQAEMVDLYNHCKVRWRWGCIWFFSFMVYLQWVGLIWEWISNISIGLSLSTVHINWATEFRKRVEWGLQKGSDHNVWAFSASKGYISWEGNTYISNYKVKIWCVLVIFRCWWQMPNWVTVNLCSSSFAHCTGY